MSICPREAVQINPSKLKTQVYGTNGSTVLPIQTDQSGRLNIRPLSSSIDSITIQGVVSANTRDLSNTSDNILIYGNDGIANHVIRTDTSGNIQVVNSKSFTQFSETLTTTNLITGSTAQDISLLSFPTVSFYVGNTGAGHADIFPQISPDNTNWVDFGGTTLLAGTQTVIVPSFFLQYARVAFKSTNPGTPTTLMIIFQAQG